MRCCGCWQVPAGPRLQEDRPSDVAQETLLKAHSCLSHQFRGRTDAETSVGWLPFILAHTLADVLRAGRLPRAWLRRCSGYLEDLRHWAWLVDDQSSLTGEAAGEQLLGWPKRSPNCRDSARAMELQHLEAAVLVAEQMGRSKQAVAKLLLRGVARLRELLDAPSRE